MDENYSSNNATKKLLGFDYQKFLALEACLNGKDNEFVWIECHGDIAYDDKSVEIKHHLAQENLNSSHIDVWKTIHNLIIEQTSLKEFNKYELLTTSVINDNSIFHKWNNKNAKEKLIEMLNVKPNATINKYYVTVSSTDEDLVKDILSRFSIYGNQPTIDEKLQLLKEHPALFIIENKYKETFLEKMLGYISNQAIKNMDNWHININEFQREMIGFAKAFCSEDYPFPRTRKKEILDIKDRSFHFIQEMKDVELDDFTINTAAIDFLRSENSTLKILEMHSSMSENIEDYEDDITGDLRSLKLKHSANILLNHSDNNHIISSSKNLYADGQLLPIKKIHGLQPVEGYFQKGRIHAIVNRKDFFWLIKK